MIFEQHSQVRAAHLVAQGRGPVVFSPQTENFAETRPREERKMTVPLELQQSIRTMDDCGVPRTEIAEALGASRNTVAKYADMEDMSPEPPAPRDRRKRAVGPHEEWIAKALDADRAAPRKQRHTAKRIYDRLAEERGYTGSCSSVCRCVAEWRREHAGPAQGCLELDWAPGTAQADFGEFQCVLAGRRVKAKLLVLTSPRSNARFCTAMRAERSECLCDGLVRIFEACGRSPRAIVLDNATEAGRRLGGIVRESKLFSQLRAHYIIESRYCSPNSGNEKGSVENAVGLLRRNLLVPVPEVGSMKELNAMLARGCARVSADAAARDGRGTATAFREDLSAMRALPGARFDAVRWGKAKADKRGNVTVDRRSYCAGPAWHDRWLSVGLRAEGLEIRADRGRHVATLAREWGPGPTVIDPCSLIPGIVARPRAFGESIIRREMPDGLAASMDRLGKNELRSALRAIGGAAEHSGFDAACAAALRQLASGRVPEPAATDMLARRIACGAASPVTVDLTVYGRVAGGREVRHAG